MTIFIMLPTVDFCFKELMKNSKVRKGFIAALLRKRSEPDPKNYTDFRQNYGKKVKMISWGFSMFLIEMADGTKMNMEMAGGLL